MCINKTVYFISGCFHCLGLKTIWQLFPALCLFTYFMKFSIDFTFTSVYLTVTIYEILLCSIVEVCGKSYTVNVAQAVPNDSVVVRALSLFCQSHTITQSRRLKVKICATKIYLVGSPLLEETAKGARKGIISSLAIAWSKRGAPVNDWRPAPRVDKKEPIRITHWLGHAMFATTSLPPIDCPNLEEKKTF